MRPCSASTSARLPLKVCGVNTTGRLNVRSYTVIVVKCTRRRSGRGKPSKSSSASARVICRARSARKLKNMIESPSRIGPTGVPSASTTTIGLMNSSVTPASYGCLKRLRSARCVVCSADAVDDRVVGELGPLPALVAVHRVVAARRPTRSRPVPALSSTACELRQVADAAGRRGVAAVGDRRARRRAARCVRAASSIERVQVLLVAVHAAVRDQADEVQRVLPPAQRSIAAASAGLLEELAVADALVDAREVLVDDPAGAHVHVADLGVAHLAGGQADRFAGGDQLRVRIPLHQRVVDRRARQRDGVVLASRRGCPSRRGR